MEKIVVCHGSSQIVEVPAIRITKYNKDFYFGFYCTVIKEQARRWATRFGEEGYINLYEYRPNQEWLDFIVACRSGQAHSYDIVEGPMADDTIYNYVQGFMDGKYSREAFWELAKFKYPTHQISFHTARALTTLKFLKGVPANEKQ